MNQVDQSEYTLNRHVGLGLAETALQPGEEVIVGVFQNITNFKYGALHFVKYLTLGPLSKRQPFFAMVTLALYGPEYGEALGSTGSPLWQVGRELPGSKGSIANISPAGSGPYYFVVNNNSANRSVSVVASIALESHD